MQAVEWRRPILTSLLATTLSVVLATQALAGPPPPPPPPACETGPPCASDEWFHEPHDPPPLPIAMRVIYAPFYLTGLVLRYGVYYVLVAPFEVLGRALAYGAEGGVEHDPDER